MDYQENEWIHETLAGKTGSFDNIVLKYQAQIYNLILKTIQNRADAEDLAQNVFVNAYSNLKSFRKESSLSTWLYSIAVNQMRNYWRGRKHKFVYSEAEIQPLTKEVAYGLYERFAADGEVAAEETREIADMLISLLPPRQREIFVLYYILGHSCDEISDILDTSPANIKIQLFRGRKFLSAKCFSGKKKL